MSPRNTKSLGRFKPGKALCIRCGKPAVWYYSPCMDGKRDFQWMFCDHCVPRGCSCNQDYETDEPYRDKLGRRLPCCEYSFDRSGWQIGRNGQIRWNPEMRSTRFIARIPVRIVLQLCHPIGWHRGGSRTGKLKT